MVFRDVLNALIDDELNLSVKLLNASYPEFPDWDQLKKRTQAGAKTIAEHTLKMFEFVFKSSDYKELDAFSKKTLKLAVLLHDIAKTRGGEPFHEKNCAERAKELLNNWGYEANVINIVYFLVKHHTFLGLMNSGYADKTVLTNELLLNISSHENKLNSLKLLELLSQADVFSRFNREGFHTSRTDWIVNVELAYNQVKSMI